MSYNPLIHGKDATERIVSIEPLDEHAILFVENKDGSVEMKEVPNRYWLLADKQLNKSFVRLEGDLHYKWGVQFTTREDFLNARKRAKYSADTYSIYDSKEALMVKDGYTYYKGMDINEVSILSFDIEATSLTYNKKDL